MRTMRRFRYIDLVIVIMLMFAPITVLSAENLSEPEGATVIVRLDENDFSCEIARYHPSLHVRLLADSENILARIESLKEQSKPILEPIVREYMLMAERLIHAAHQRDEQGRKENTGELRARFRAAKEQLTTILGEYRQQIDDLLQQQTLQAMTSPASSGLLRIAGVPSGRYRIYGRISFATTTFHWFELVTIQGGECRTMTLTRGNMTNPYWTDLNWWSFMNLDFSKHH